MAKKSKIIPNITIIDIAHKGKSIGKDEEGYVYLIEGTVPGDIVNANYYKKRKGLRVAKVTEHVKLSERRTEPVCDHFGLCGGCKWQNFKYESQLFFKEKQVRDAIERIAMLDGSKVESILPCDDIYFYRNKMEYSFCSQRWITEEEAASDAEIKDKKALGFHRPGYFNKVINIDRCHLQDDFGNEIRNFLHAFALEKDYSYFDYGSQTGLLRNVTLRNTSINEWMVSVIFRDRDEEKIEEVMAAMKEKFPQITSLYYVVNQKQNDTLYDQEYHLYHGVPKITEKLGEVKYNIGPKSFFQTNSLQAKKLYDVAVVMAELKSDDLVYDLYTGLGSIALYIADKVKYVVGIEEIPQAIEDALVNQKLNGTENASFFTGDVKDIFTTDFIDSNGHPDVVITDPPRAGMHETVINTLLKLEAPKIVYISCNPATQARDIKMLSESYELIKVKPVDMFPHTQHIECVALLKLKN